MSAAGSFRPPRWLRSRHLQTILPNSPLRRIPALEVRRETVELPDGDFLHADWTGRDGPIVVVLHGLEGSVRSPYVRAILNAVAAAGWCGVILHFRGCSGEPNRLARSYHAGETEDLRYFLRLLSERHPRRALGAVGYSLGGNVLLKYLGEGHSPLRTAVAVSVPFDLQDASWAMDRGFARFYQALLMRRMRTSLRQKFGSLAGFPLGEILRLRSFRELDDRLTAPLHGFANGVDYYHRSSCRTFLKTILTPTLIVHARDDPFMTPASVPEPAELSSQVRLELSEHGGHVGFLEGTRPWRLHCWLERRIVDHFRVHLDPELEHSSRGVGMAAEAAATPAA